MTLSGLNRITERPRGGISKVSLLPATRVAGTAAAEYHFREDGARYSETLEGDSLQPLVRHTLEMEFPATEVSHQAVDELLAGSAAGFVATVETANGRQFAVGRSERFGTTYPLRVVKTSYASGSSPGDFPMIVIVLECVY
jgi:hypothetical protein